MVRMRARIAEDEEPGSALAKLRGRGRGASGRRRGATLRRAAPRAPARARGRHGFEREDLFAAWRLFFERLADVYPAVLVFEDMQWADASLLDFIEYLLEWSRSSPIFVVTLARPELLERRPTWGAGKPQLHLASTSSRSPARRWRSCSTGSSPACRTSCGAQILDRAEGVPLYAVETVRMLLDRGAARPGGSRLPPDRHDRGAARCPRRCTR